MQTIKVLVVDDHPVFREGVYRILEDCEDIEVVGAADSYQAAVAVLRQHHPDVALLDLSMPGLDGIDLTTQIRKEFPETRPIILSLHDREDYIVRSIEAGAKGYVLKGAKSQSILDAIRSVNKGEHYFCPLVNSEIVRHFLAEKNNNGKTSRYDALSDREQQVFRLLAEGYKTTRIADLLYVSPKTIEKHRVNIMRKLDKDNLVELVKYAISLGIVDV